MIDDTLKDQTLQLTAKERAQLAHFLIDSLNTDIEFESGEAWSKELEHRLNQYEKGQSSTKSWDTIKSKAQNTLNE